MSADIASLRAQFSAAGLSRGEVAADPVAQFARWFAQAREAGLHEPSAIVLGCATKSGAPSQRCVLMKTFDRDGLVFFTNHGSRKAAQMFENAAVSALFPWHALARQVIVEGTVARIGAEESRAYFQTRPREAQLGAWASRQSAALESRAVLAARMKKITARLKGAEVPLPEFWGGYRISPARVEFWQGRAHRLHDRILYTRGGEGWEICRLSP